MTEYREGSEIAGRFVVLDRVGEGGMGAVYRALQTSLDRQVALKVLHAQNAFTARARRRFAREARAIARLNHPHIAGVYDFGVDDDHRTLWLAMELIEGDGMTRLKRESIDLVRLLSLSDQILSALSAAHARSIIHRDLKPSNILLTHNNEQHEVIKLVDFGLAAMHNGDLDLSGAPGLEDSEEESNERVILGTPRYMAPELFKRAPADPRVDIYALGVILFEILVGQPPFPGDDPRKVMKAHLNAPIPQLQPRGGVHVPADFERLVYKMLAKKPRERYQSAAEVREDIAHIIGEFSYVPWMTMGPRNDAASFHLAGNVSRMGFASQFGGQTIAPASMLQGASQFGMLSALEAPLVGRAAERRVIEKNLRRALHEHQGCLLLMEGEAGVGKSRLLDWVRVRVTEAGVMRVGHGSYSRAGGGFSGLQEVLERLLGTGEYPNEMISFVLEQLLTGFSPEELEICTRLVRPSGHEDPFEGSSTERTLADQERVFATIERLLRHLSTERPVLVLLDNLHEAGDATIGFLEHLIVGLHLSPAPIVFMAAVRSEELEQHPRLRATLERLSRFSAEDVVRLGIKRLESDTAQELILKLMPLDEALAARLAARAEGNPLYIRQILNFLQESGKLTYDDGRWMLADGVQLTREIPDEVADMMRYRATQTCRQYHDPEAMRAMLERCAILGARFDYRLLRHMLTLEAGQPWLGHLDVLLEEMVRQGLLREIGTSGADMLEFEHGIMRDVLLQDLKSRRALRSLHKAAAEAKLEVWGPRANERALEIADHYRAARDVKGVYRYTIKAAFSALSACDLKGAMALFRQAEKIAEEVDDAEMASFTRTSTATALNGDQIALQVAHLERRLGEYDQARQGYKKILSSAEGATALWGRWGLGDLSRRQGDYDEAVSWYEEARREGMRLLQFSREVTPEEADRVDAHCLYGLGMITMLRGDLRGALMTLGETLEKSQQTGEQVLEASVLRALADVCWRLGQQDKADVYRRRSMMLSESFGDREELALALLHSARALFANGQVGEAEARAEAAREYFEDIGKRHHVAYCLLTLGAVSWSRQENKEAAQLLRQAHRFFEMFHDRRGLADCKLLLASLAFSIKRFQDTQALVRDALEGYRALGARHGEAVCWLLVGRLEHMLEKHSKASRTFEDATRVFQELGDVRQTIVSEALRALALDALEQYDAADDVLSWLFAQMRTYEVSEEPLGAALEALTERLGTRRPELALELDSFAEQVWRRLGRPIRVHAS